jgi:DnaK suppressor protein
VDIERYRARLHTLQAELNSRMRRDTDAARTVTEDQADPSDIARVDELKDEILAVANTNSVTLGQIAEALQRMEEGTYGLCLIDGEPIGERRLDSVPWASYCVKHQEEREQAEGLRTPSL